MYSIQVVSGSIQYKHRKSSFYCQSPCVKFRVCFLFINFMMLPNPLFHVILDASVAILPDFVYSLFHLKSDHKEYGVSHKMCIKSCPNHTTWVDFARSNRTDVNEKI
uniref:Uncharacterized protein n=1 Tax=Cacopsylla melanoneura TaxID=428564 RepID=A0A8D8QGV8_9HEMI